MGVGGGGVVWASNFKKITTVHALRLSVSPKVQVRCSNLMHTQKNKRT